MFLSKPTGATVCLLLIFSVSIVLTPLSAFGGVVPQVEFQSAASTNSNSGPQDTSAAAVAFLNTATAQQMEFRLGVNRGTAAQIVANRPYADVNQLHAKKIVNLAEYQRIERRLGLKP